jgi:predicted  nucleic acid-binding Zn-ribbon protein
MAIAAVAGLVSAVGAAAAGLTVFGALATTFTGFAYAFALGAGLSIVSRALTPKPSLGAQLRGITQTTREPAGTRKLIYGQMRVGGNVVFIEHSGSDNKYLHLVVVFATHHINSFEEFYFNDKKIWTLSGGFQGNWGTYVQLNTKLGTDTQTAVSSLVSASNKWTNDHKLSGIAYAHFRLEWDTDQFPQGVPNITAVIKGKRVYDPRTQVFAYSDNPALCLRDYMIDQDYGLGETALNINTQSVIDAADLCEEQVSLDGGGTQDRYTCNGVLDTGNQIKDNIEQLLSAMGGRLTYSGGEYFVDGAEYQAPTVTFDEADCISDIQTQTKQSRRSVFNGVKGIFVSEEKNYKVLDYPPQISSTFATEDGDPILLDMPLPFVTNNTQAQRLAKIALLKSRQQVIITMSVNLKGLQVKVGDTINVTNERLGYSSKVFEVIDYSLAIADGGSLAVNLTCIETASAVYDWTTSDQEDFLAGGELDLYDGRTVDNVTSLTSSEIGLRGPDGRLKSAVELTWTAPDDAFIEFYTVRFNKNGTTDYFEVQTRQTRALVEGLDLSSNYDFLVQAQNLIGVKSTGTSITNLALNGDTTAPSAPTSVTLTAGINQITCEWTNPTDIDLAFVEVHVTTTSGTPSVSATPSAKIGGEEYILTGLSQHTRFFYLRAVDFSGNKSGYTTVVSAQALLVDTADVADDAITTDQIADDAVTTDQIASGAVTITEIETSVADLINGAAQAVDVLNVQVESGDVLDLETGQDVLIQNLGDVAIFVNESNQTINNSINTTNTTLANLEATIVDLTSGTSDIFVSTSAPVAGVGGVPDPIPTFSRWYDSDDNNEPYYWDGSAWQSLADPRIASNASAITTLQSGLNTANSNISANSSAISVLDTTTVSQGNSITTLSSDVTTLQSSLTTAEGNIGTAQTDITTNATAITNLTTRVTDNEGDITSITTDVTTLQTDLSTAEGDITTNSTAISGLTTRVTTAEGNITTNASDITALETTVNDVSTGVVATSNALTALTTRVTTAEGDITTNATDITALETTVNDATTGVAATSSAVTSLDSRVTTAEGSITSLTSDVTTLQSDLTSAEGDITTNASAITSLTTRVTTAEGSITTNTSDITALETTVNDGSTGVAANATAISGLDTRITTAEGSITSQASDITALETTVNDGSTGVAANASAISTLDTRITSAENDITSLSASNVTALEVAVEDLTKIQGETDDVITTEAGNDLLLNLPTDVASATSAATNTLDSRITSAEGTLTSQSTDITELKSDLTTLDGEVTTNAGAITSLTTRVTTAEGSITSQASDITSLQSSLTTTDGNVSTNATAITGLDTRLTSAEGTITSQSSDITILQSDITTAEGDISTNATAITGLTTRVTTAEGNITSNSSDITSLQSDVTTAEGNITSNASAISALDTRVTSAEGTITSQASDITTLQSDLTTAEGNISSNATAVSGLTTRVTTAEGNISSNASSITALTSTVNDPTTGLAATASVASGASTTAAANSTSITDLEAEAYLTVSAGGNVSGFKATADASGSSFTIQADRFALVSTDESQTTTPFAVDTTTGTVSFNANVEVDGDLIATGSISGGAIGNGQVDTITVASNAITLSQNQRFTDTTSASSSAYVTHFTSSYFNIDDYTDPVFVRFTSFLYPRASGGGLMVNAYARANIRTQLLCYNASNTVVQTLTITTSNIYSGAATTNGLTFLNRFTITNSSVVKVKARMQFNKAGGTSDQTALFSGDVEFNVLKR